MRMFVFVLCLAFIALAAQAAIPEASPEAAVRAAYAADALALRDNGVPVISDAVVGEKLFSRSLLRTMNVAPKLPADPFSDSSPHLVDLKIAPASENGASATVVVDFARGDGARERLTYALVMERREWRIDDIDYALLDGESRTLRGMIAR
jgi:hypothetical protein